jgi:beta-xylosidase
MDRALNTCFPKEPCARRIKGRVTMVSSSPRWHRRPDCVLSCNEVTGNCGTGRTTRIPKCMWNADGIPNFGTALPINTAITLPSGAPGGPVATYYLNTNRNSGKVMDMQQLKTSDGARIGQ